MSDFREISPAGTSFNPFSTLIKSEILPSGISPGVSIIVISLFGILLLIDFKVVPEYLEVVILLLPKSRFITDDFPTFETPSTVALTFLF